jgi:hypothetical protein
MYIAGIIGYLIWPALIIISWLVILFAVKSYEKKFPD